MFFVDKKVKEIYVATLKMKYLKVFFSIFLIGFILFLYLNYDNRAKLNYSLPNNYIIHSKEKSTIFREKDHNVIEKKHIKHLSLLDKIIYSTDFLEEFLIFLFSIFIGFIYQKKSKDKKISILIFSLGILSFFQIYLIFFENLYFIYFTFLFFIGFLLLNLSFRFFGKELSSDFFILEILLCLSIIFIFWEYFYIQEIQFIFERCTTYGLRFIAFSSFLCILSWIFSLIKRKFHTSFTKNLCIILSFIIIAIIPYFILKLEFYISLLLLRKLIFLLVILFLILFSYGNYKSTFILIKISLNYLITPFLVIFFVLLFYFISLRVLNFFSLYNGFYEIFTITYLIIFSFFLSKIKKLIDKLIYSLLFKLNSSLEDSLKKMIHISVEPSSLENRISKINQIVKNLLDISKILILVPENDFEEIESSRLIKIKEKSNIWQYLSNQIDIIFKDSLIENSKSVKDVYKLFLNYDIHIAYPILQIDSHKSVGFLLLGKENWNDFSVSEIIFLKKYSQIIEILFNHYKLIKNEIDKQQTVEVLEETLSFNKSYYNHIQTKKNELIEANFINKASVGISGDYINIFFKDSYLYFFLGDICGHGLSTSYLINALNGLVDFQINLGYNLKSIFSSINDFFLKRYKGNEFLTLIGGFYNLKNQELNFINAGHLPLIQITESGTLNQFSTSQQAIGLFNVNYEIETIKTFVNDKVFLFTDGITETINSRNELFGEERLLDFLKNNYQLQPKEIILKLEKTLSYFNHSTEQDDDLSLICFNIKKENI